MNRLLVLLFLLGYSILFSQSINGENQGVREFEIDCSIRALRVEKDDGVMFVSMGYDFIKKPEVYFEL